MFQNVPKHLKRSQTVTKGQIMFTKGLKTFKLTISSQFYQTVAKRPKCLKRCQNVPKHSNIFKTVPTVNGRETRPHQTIPDKTRPDQTKMVQR